MNTLRVLLVDSDPGQSRRIASVLSNANYSVLPTVDLAEASEAVCAQKFDAVLLGSPLPPGGLAEFTANLRALEESQRTEVRTPVLSISPQCADLPGAMPRVDDVDIDGYLPEEFDPAVLADAVNRLSLAHPPRRSESPKGGPGRHLPIFEPDEFQAQVCNDSELLVEIIDLFLTESVDQIAEMRGALKARDYQRLGRVAHTIKGSLGSLHASMARSRANDLEMASRDREEQVCRFSLAALEQDLEILKPELLSLRELTCAQ